MRSPDDLVADYVRSSMSVQPPATLGGEVMRAVSAVPQERRGWLNAFGPYTPAIAAIAAAALVVAIGAVIAAPRNIGPPTESAGPTTAPAPTLTPEDARILTEPGDVIRIPAFDSRGQFGTIRLERGDEFGSYEDYIPLAAMDFGEVFFVEVHVTYEVDRATEDPYGNIDFGWAVDADRDGLDEDDVTHQHIGYSIDGLEPETGPSPLLPFVNAGPQEMTGWIALELPAAGAEYDIYLVQLADVPEGQPPPASAVASALLRGPSEPVGLTVYDWDNPPPMAEPSGPLPSFHVLPTPMPSPASTFEPAADADADALFAETQTCTNTSMSLIVTFPASWHTNAGYEDLPACSFFAPEEMDTELIYNGFDQTPRVSIVERLEWIAGEDPLVERVPIAGREAWQLTFTEEHLSTPGSIYLIPLTENPYGPFAQVAGTSHQRVVERMLLRLEFTE